MEILELKNTITKAKSSMDELNSIMESREEKISEMKDKTTEITPPEWQKEQTRKNNEQNLRDLWNCNKRLNIPVSQSWKERKKNMGLKQCSKK